MRGKLCSHLLIIFCVRITPAHAGKTPLQPGLSALVPDHPRACGENESLCVVEKREIGSPPRMRGKLSFYRAE